MAIPPSAAPGSVPPTEAPAAPKKRKPLTPEQMQRRALRQQQRRQAAEEAQADWDRRATQEFHQITDGSSQTISKRGVRQRGVSDPEAAAMVRQRLGSGPADNRPSTAAVPLNPSATPGAGRGRRLSETMIDPYKPTGFRSSNASPGGSTFVLRTEAERQARIAESPFSRKPAPAPPSRPARAGVPALLARPAAQPSPNSPAAIISGAEAAMGKRPAMDPQPGPVAPARPGSANSPAAIIQGAEGAMRGKPLFPRPGQMPAASVQSLPIRASAPGAATPPLSSSMTDSSRMMPAAPPKKPAPSPAMESGRPGKFEPLKVIPRPSGVAAARG